MSSRECESLGPCDCSECACRRNLACVMYGPNRGKRAVFWHPTVWPKSKQKWNSHPSTSCYFCGGQLNRTTVTWLCEDRRKNPRRPIPATLVVKNHSRMSEDEFRKWMTRDRNKDIRVQCEMVLYSCHRGCDVENVNCWQEYLNSTSEPTPHGAASRFRSEHPRDRGNRIDEKYHPIPRVKPPHATCEILG